MGAESLPPSTVESMYRWVRNGDSSTLPSLPTLNFTPLAQSDDGIYTCTVTITSPLLNNTRTAMSGGTLTVTRKSVHRSLILDYIILGVMPGTPSDLTVTVVTATSITIYSCQSRFPIYIRDVHPGNSIENNTVLTPI